MIPRNVMLALEQQKIAKLGLTEKDVKTIREEGVEAWVKEEFGVEDKKMVESVTAAITSEAPEIAELEKKPEEQKKDEKKSFW